MTDQEFDLAVATYLEQMGMALPEQIAQARRLQLEGSESGPPIPLAEALVRCGVLTPLLRENIERSVRARQAAPGQFSQYKLLDKLGEGGMGEVYLAEDSEAKRKVAIKVLPRKYSDDPDFVARFRREAEAATKLKHDNIVGAYATGLELGYCFYVMEYCEGEALDRRLRREGRLPWIQAVRIVLQAARGLQYAHANGFIHRDIKPANIMLTRSGTAKILDLGLSKRVTERDASFQTASGAVMGTPHYIAPEQANGESVDGRADIYSLGATLYHLVTGTTPYAGTTPIEILYKQVHAQLPNPQDLNDDIPDNLVHVIRKMMAKDPKDRYPDGEACVTDLEEVIAGRVPKSDVLDPAKSAVALLRARPLRKPPTQRREPGPSPARAVVVAAGLGAAALVLALLFLRNSGPEEKPVAEKAPTPRPPLVEAPVALPPEPPARPPSLEPWRNGIDLLPLIDPAKDAVAGRWSSEADGLRVDASTRARIEIPYLPCEQYDFRIVFTRLEGNGLTSQLLTLGGQPFNWHMGAAGNTLFAFDRVQFQPLETNPSAQRAERCLETKRRHEATIQVRLNTVTAFLDGRQIARWSSNLKDLSRDPAWRLRDDALLGLGSSETPTIFHSVEVREVFGRGRAMRTPAEAAWRPIFDGRSMDGFNPIRGQWTADSGSLLGIADPTSGAALSTRKEFGDADYRVRFEPKGLTYLECGVRYGPQGSDRVALDRVELRSLEGKTVTLFIRCRGGSVEATVDGNARALGQKAAEATGPVVVFFRGDGLRIQSLEVREQRPDASSWQPIFDGTLDGVAPASTAWKPNNGALEAATPQSFRLVTKREAKDGEWRVVLEARMLIYLVVDSRLSGGGKSRAMIDRPQLAPLEGNRLEILVHCSGEDLRMTLNGRVMTVTQIGKSGAGTLRLEGQADSIRIHSIEFRPLP